MIHTGSSSARLFDDKQEGESVENDFIPLSIYFPWVLLVLFVSQEASCGCRIIWTAYGKYTFQVTLENLLSTELPMILFC
jgi:hypothetical protein